jgi:hypothetical protein
VRSCSIVFGCLLVCLVSAPAYTFHILGPKPIAGAIPQAEFIGVIEVEAHEIRGDGVKRATVAAVDQWAGVPTSNLTVFVTAWYACYSPEAIIGNKYLVLLKTSKESPDYGVMLRGEASFPVVEVEGTAYIRLRTSSRDPDSYPMEPLGESDPDRWLYRYDLVRDYVESILHEQREQ